MVKIVDINREMTNYKIKVQVMKKSNLQSGKKISGIEIVLVDEDGTRIHASIDEAYVKKFEGKIVENSSYVINNFNFYDYNTLYRTNPLDFKITFYTTTNIVSCEGFSVNLTNNYKYTCRTL
ncbi:unnamed protein product [Microthlaspi erraticum]|uniref:Replication protein A 70 kDa DNA-binding subunit B/D first OB fold domain-containing protein n=1 Tax=Microthlaspi erraticum TaxID=1685480 RepID=A0A6D2KZ82_9BRAS|nr:unnamed protein product [Microthlaspi erraticum]CAA7052575.1 unnamed protein product [Microthlaspi erraticum]